MLLLRALMVVLGTMLTVGGAVALRADSAGPANRPAVVLALAAGVALAQWRLLRQQRQPSTLLSGLLLTQLACQLGLQAVGGIGGGLSDVVCCPAVPVHQSAGAVAVLTAQAGLTLLAVQILAASVTAMSVRTLHGLVLDALRHAAASLRAHLLPLARMHELLCASARPVPPTASASPRRPEAPLLLRRLLLARTVTRRGPPRRHPRPPSFLSHLRVRGVAVS